MIWGDDQKWLERGSKLVDCKLFYYVWVLGSIAIVSWHMYSLCVYNLRCVMGVVWGCFVRILECHNGVDMQYVWGSNVGWGFVSTEFGKFIRNYVT